MKKYREHRIKINTQKNKMLNRKEITFTCKINHKNIRFLFVDGEWILYTTENIFV